MEVFFEMGLLAQNFSWKFLRNFYKNHVFLTDNRSYPMSFLKVQEGTFQKKHSPYYIFNRKMLNLSKLRIRRSDYIL